MSISWIGYRYHHMAGSRYDMSSMRWAKLLWSGKLELAYSMHRDISFRLCMLSKKT